MDQADGTGKHRLDISYVWKVHGASAGGYIPPAYYRWSCIVSFCSFVCEEFLMGTNTYYVYLYIIKAENEREAGKSLCNIYAQ